METCLVDKASLFFTSNRTVNPNGTYRVWKSKLFEQDAMRKAAKTELGSNVFHSFLLLDGQNTKALNC